VHARSLRERLSVKDQLYVIPNRHKPKLVVPASGRLAGIVVGTHGLPDSARQRVLRRLLALALRLGLGRLIVADRLAIAGPTSAERTIADLPQYLAGVLGEAVEASMPITVARSNRKPVLQLLSPRGQVLAFCKVGVNPLTSDLVSREAEVLRALNAAALASFEAPEVMYHGQWRSQEILVCSPLPTGRAARPERAVVQQAMVQLSLADVALTPSTGSDPGYLVGLADRVVRETASARPSHRHQVLSCLSEQAARLRDQIQTPLRLGNWHGDWTPWNCGQLGDRLLVWDWERFGTGVPLGFDSIHYDLQLAVTGGGKTHLGAAQDALDRASSLLKEWTVSPDKARCTVAAYLIEISLRYLMDDQQAAGGHGGAVEDWALPVIEQFLSDSDAPGIKHPISDVQREGDPR
jgi:hypothetical protein